MNFTVRTPSRSLHPRRTKLQKVQRANEFLRSREKIGTNEIKCSDNRASEDFFVDREKPMEFCELNVTRVWILYAWQQFNFPSVLICERVSHIAEKSRRASPIENSISL